MTTLREKLQKRVATMDNDRERLLKVAQRQTYGSVVRLRASLIQAYLRGDDPGPAFRRAQDEFQGTLLDGLITSHVQATARTYAMFRAVKGIQLDRSSFTGILQAMQETAQFEPRQLLELRKKYEVVAKESSADAIASAQQLLGQKAREIAAGGINTRDALSQLREAMDSAGLKVENPRLLETVYRTEFNTAYSDARMIANEEPAIQEILWGFQYVTIGDDRVRPVHKELDKCRFEKNSIEWFRYRPPCDWNCRCSFIEIFVDEKHLATPNHPPEFIDVGGKKVPVQPGEGFDRTAA